MNDVRVYYIEGDSIRGKDVIRMLESYGGNNSDALDGDVEEQYYYFNSNDKKIRTCKIWSSKFSEDAIKLHLPSYNKVFLINKFNYSHKDICEFLSDEYNVKIKEPFLDKYNVNKLYFVNKEDGLEIIDNSSTIVSLLKSTGYLEVHMPIKFKEGAYISFKISGTDNYAYGLFKSYDYNEHVLICSAVVYNNYDVLFDKELYVKEHEIGYADDMEISNLKSAVKKYGYYISSDNKLIEVVHSFARADYCITKAEDGEWMLNIFSHVDKDGYARCVAAYDKNYKVLPYTEDYMYLIGTSENKHKNN